MQAGPEGHGREGGRKGEGQGKSRGLRVGWGGVGWEECH